MTPKEKACELVYKMHRMPCKDGWMSTSTDLSRAKNQATFIVEQIIEACEYNHVESHNSDWWEKVKEEIKTID